MTSVSEVQPDHRPETVRALANQYSDHHTKMENYVNVLYVTSRLTRRLGIEPRIRGVSWPWASDSSGCCYSLH